MIQRVNTSGKGCIAEGNFSYTANAQNQLSGLLYDIAGNVIDDGNGNQPTYDAESTMATDAGVTYDYDADGVRIEKSSGTMYWSGPSGTWPKPTFSAQSKRSTSISTAHASPGLTNPLMGPSTFTFQTISGPPA